MFTKRLEVTLSEDTKAAFSNLDADVLALTQLVDELIRNHREIVGVIKDSIKIAVNENGGAAPNDLFVTPESGEDQEKRIRREPTPPPPESMVTSPLSGDNSMDPDDPNRVRSTPFTRAPRNVQVTWLKQVMADGRWYAPVTIAQDVANDERHFRYLRSALSGRLREMHEDGLVERRAATVKGAMFEYRLRREQPTVEAEA